MLTENRINKLNAIKKYHLYQASQDITQRVKTFEDACRELKIDSDNILPYKIISDDSQKRINAYKKLEIIIEVLNEGWTPDYFNYNQYKYYPYFNMGNLGKAGSSGFGFRDSDVGHTGTLVGGRLVLKSRELSDYCGKQFEDIYKDYMEY